MKKLFSIVLALMTLTTFAQKVKSYYDLPLLAKSNLSFLDKSKNISSSRVFIKEHTLVIADQHGNEEIFLPWTEVPDVVRRLETGDHKQLYNGTNKTLKSLRGNYIKAGTEYHPIPTEMTDLIVAIDPGHFAGNISEAIREDKFVKMHGTELGLKKDISFYEADLNDITATIVKLELEKLGAKSFLTKGAGQNGIGKSFHDWFKKDFRADLQGAYIDGDVSKNNYEAYAKADSNQIFNTFYRFVEFRKRIDLINNSNPSITVVIHYNASEGGKRDADGFLKPVEANYSMAFVPGAFLGHELQRYSEKLDFLRLLLSPDLDKSMRLAHLILQAERGIGVEPVKHDQHVLDERYCTPTDYDGVYCRNLAMTRTIRGPVVYLEALLQDNKNEAVVLAKKDYVLDHPQYGKMMVPKRCYDVAMSIVKGITDWLEENKSFSQTASIQIKSPNK
ncbi:MAG TPA: hypothetical protein VGQ59_11890 [Cyclobacteriaceae bacterium]|jgi:N-acetylmuramoyl-L-alanine amidase|nr:hypothetical protein [Cyclobacteriaceae bacterium]